MSENATEGEKVYPGSIDRYRQLRSSREALAQADASGEFPPTEPQIMAAAVIAEELAGLAYILDGIRYSARAK